MLYPVARPIAWILDKWPVAENTEYLKERQLRGVIEQHIESDSAEIDLIEGIGALNFLEIVDVPVEDEGEEADLSSIIELPTTVDLPILPVVQPADDPFVRDVHASGKKWVILTDRAGKPQLIPVADSCLRAVLIDIKSLQAYEYCHRPIVVTERGSPQRHSIASPKKGAGCQERRSDRQGHRVAVDARRQVRNYRC